MKSLSLFLALVLGLCMDTSERGLMSPPPGFPPVPFPKENQFTPERWALGKKLFYDPILSQGNEISCASCHLSSHAFSDTNVISPGVEGRLGTRNAPSLANVAYHPYYLREGSVPTLEMQVLVPIQEHDEMSSNIVEAARRIAEIDEYVKMSVAAYNRDPDPYVIQRSLAVFQRTLISGDSKYDRHLQGDEPLLNESELRGMQLFFSDKSLCSQCHNGFNFTDYSLTNTGLYSKYKDPGRFRVTLVEKDRSIFKTPSLRNVGLTAPYMHDGSLETLEEVIDHYVTGGHPHPNKSPILHPLFLDDQDQEDLINFLHTLTDSSFIQDHRFKP